MNTLRILKAFAWIRWRMLINSFEKTGSRDVLERFSLAIEKLGPLLAAILLIPSALGLLGLGIVAGYSLAAGDARIAITAVRFLLLPVTILAIVGPLFLPAADRTNPVRFLLLPIRTSTLYLAQAAGAFGDPWNALMVPLVIGVPIGLAAGGALLPALLSIIAAIVFVLLIIGLSALATSVLHLLVRDRRRGEMLALLFIVAIPVVAMLPGLLDVDDDGPRRRGRRGPLLPAWASEVGARAFSVAPSEMFVSAMRAGADGDLDRAGTALGGLAIGALLVHGAGFFAFTRMLGSPGTNGGKRSGSMRGAWTTKLPGLSLGASAVALAQLRLALRTPRGRSILLSPLAMLIIFGVMMYRSGDMNFGPFEFDSGLGLATFASFMCLLSILPIAMNQFAVDRAGLTLTLLSPLRDDEILSGKAAGNALVAAAPTLFSVVATMLVFPGGSPAMWIALLLGLASVYLLVAPIAAMCSAVFPRSVNMNSIGRGSNAHGAAGLIGLLSFIAAGLPPLLLTLAASRLLDRPSLTPVLLGVWCLLAYGINRLLFIPTRRIFTARRENLAMLD